MKKYTVDAIKNDIDNIVYYLKRTEKGLQEGDNVSVWLARAMEYAARLSAEYVRADFLELENAIDYKAIYQDAVKKAVDEIERMDSED